MAQKIRSIHLAAIGATHPRPDQMTSLDEVFDALDRWDIKLDDPIKSKSTMERCGMLQRWYSGKTSNELLQVAAVEAMNHAVRHFPHYDPAKTKVCLCGGATLPKNYAAQSAFIANALGVPDYQCQTRDISGACASLSQALIDIRVAMLFNQWEWGCFGGAEVIGSRGTDPIIAKENFGFWDDNSAFSVVHGSSRPGTGIIATKSFSAYRTFAESVGSGSDYIHPINTNSTREELVGRFMCQAPDAHLNDGTALYTLVTTELPGLVKQFLCENKIEIGPRTYFIGHGANLRMNDRVARNIGFWPENNLNMLGANGRCNMSSVSWLTTLEHYARIPRFFQVGDVIVIVTFSGGILGDIIIYRVSDEDLFLLTA